MLKRTTTSVIALLLLCAAHAFSQQAGTPDIHRLSVPGKTWAMDVDLNDFVTSTDEFMADMPSTLQFLGTVKTLGEKNTDVKPNAQAFVLTALPKQSRRFAHVAMLTIKMEPVLVNGDATALRAVVIDDYLKSKRVTKRDIKTFEYKQFPVVKYSITNSDNPILMQTATIRGLEAFLAQDDIGIRIQFTAQPLKDSDEKLFYTVLDSIKITDTSHPTNSFDYYHLGRAFYQQKDYAKAVEAFSKALVLEHQQRQLSATQWRNLIEDATDSFGATGDRARAKAVLEYGISNDPTYPYFHLGLARLYASLNDLDNTIVSLQKVYQNAQNGRKFIGVPFLPDPLHDTSFAAFKKDPKFRDAVKAMKKLLKD